MIQRGASAPTVCPSNDFALKMGALLLRKNIRAPRPARGSHGCTHAYMSDCYVNVLIGMSLCRFFPGCHMGPCLDRAAVWLRQVRMCNAMPQVALPNFNEYRECVFLNAMRSPRLTTRRKRTVALGNLCHLFLCIETRGSADAHRLVEAKVSLRSGVYLGSNGMLHWRGRESTSLNTGRLNCVGTHLIRLAPGDKRLKCGTTAVHISYPLHVTLSASAGSHGTASGQ